VKEVNALLKPIEQECDEDQERDKGPELTEVDGDAEYIDEDRYTTVTVEAIDLSKDAMYEAGMVAKGDIASPDDEEPEAASSQTAMRDGKRIWTKDRPEKQGRTRKRRRTKFRYENKAERKLTRVKEKSKNSRQAKARRTA
jgi:ribosomal RNA-processing protein 17